MQTSKSSALASGNFGIYEFLTGEEVLPEKGQLEKGQLEKAATVKRLEYSLLDGEMKKQTDIAKNNIKD